MLYYENIDSLNAQTTNWVLTNFRRLFVWVVSTFAPYLQEDTRANTWAALYQKAVNDINLESERSKTSGSGRRMKIRSY